MKNKNFISLFTGQTISNTGEQVYLIALPLIIYELTRSTLTMGTVSAIIAIPQLIFGLFIGVLIDKTNKKKIMVISVLIQFILMTLLAILSSFDSLTTNVIYIITFLYSLLSLIFLSTYRSIIPEIVNRKELLKANSYIQSSLSLVRVIGPIIAGGVIGLVGVGNSIFVNSLSFLILFILLINVSVPTDVKSRIQQEDNINKSFIKSLFSDVSEGLVFIYNNKKIFSVISLSFFINIGLAISMSMMVFYLHGNTSVSISQLGYIYSIGGVITFFFTLMVPLINKLYKNKLIIILVFCSVSGLALILLPITQNWISIGVVLGLVTGGVTLASVYINTLIQVLTPNHLLGRVIITSQLLARLATPLALFFGGWASHFIISIPTLFIISGIIILIITSYQLFNCRLISKVK
ncbi:MFS transporter [Shouchella miscanthi]|uniref:MFS transporter n=1 Tax=Shouchella miscanthi TaxID=2598861 RepID=A0ABU6NPY0_9BACI|nr:MFS transporter [Shouchella miscanthi]